MSQDCHRRLAILGYPIVPWNSLSIHPYQQLLRKRIKTDPTGLCNRRASAIPSANRIVCWCPQRELSVLPSGRAWMGCSGNSVSFFTLEGFLEDRLHVVDERGNNDE